MIISCPNCSTEYNFPDAEYREGRKVKCKICSEVFALPALDEESEILAASPPQVKPKAAPPPRDQDEDEDLPDEDDEDDGGKSFVDPFSDDTQAPRARKPGAAGEPFAVEDMSNPTLPKKPAKPKVAQQFGAEDGGDKRFEVDSPAAGQKKPKSNKMLVALAAVLGLALVAVGLHFFAPGLVGKYLHSGKSAEEEKIEVFATDQIKDFALKDVAQYFVDNERAGKLFVIQGKVVNNFKTSKDLIKIEATLFDKNGGAVVSKKLLIGNALSLYQLQMLSEQELESNIENKVGVLTVNTGVPPGGEVPFVVIFYKPSDAVQEFGVKVIEAKDPPKN